MKRQVQIWTIVGAFVGLVLAVIDGWFKGFFGFRGPVIVVLYAILGVVIGIFVVQHVREKRRRVILWGTVGWVLGTLFGMLRNKGWGYVIADGIDYMAFGVFFGFSLENRLRGAKIGAMLGAIFGCIVGLLPNVTFSFDSRIVSGNRFLVWGLSTLFDMFWGMMLGALFVENKVWKQSNSPK